LWKGSTPFKKGRAIQLFLYLKVGFGGKTPCPDMHSRRCTLRAEEKADLTIEEKRATARTEDIHGRNKSL